MYSNFSDFKLRLTVGFSKPVCNLCFYHVLHSSEEGKRALTVNTLENNFFTVSFCFETRAVVLKIYFIVPEELPQIYYFQ